jgi:very-short-patch-repair endonuclease
VVECESHEFHSQPEAFRYDVRRYTRMVLAGWIVVRLVWEDVMHKPDAVHATLVDAVRLAEQHALCRTRPA